MRHLTKISSTQVHWPINLGSTLLPSVLLPVACLSFHCFLRCTAGLRQLPGLVCPGFSWWPSDHSDQRACFLHPWIAMGRNWLRRFLVSPLSACHSLLLAAPLGPEILLFMLPLPIWREHMLWKHGGMLPAPAGLLFTPAVSVPGLGFLGLSPHPALFLSETSTGTHTMEVAHTDPLIFVI